MQNYTVKIKKKEKVAKDTFCFYFEKPESFKYHSGQYINISLDKYIKNDSSASVRSMSLASAPHEEFLMVVMRMTNSSFKNILKDLPMDSDINIMGPFGHLKMLKATDKPHIFLAGGVGMAPFRSIVLDNQNNSSPQQIYLFYSDKMPDNSIFLDELTAINFPNFKFIPTMTGDVGEEWQGERGRINNLLIKKYVKNFENGIYYIIGLPKMVMGMREMLIEDLGISHMEIETELFTGYR